MASWTAFVARRGARQHRSLVLLVLLVQIAAVALAAAFPALLAEAEQSGVRRSLTTTDGTAVTIIADRPTGSVQRTVRGAVRAVDRLLGDAARSSAPAVSSSSVLGEGAGPRARVHPYLGEVPAGSIRITSGAWPAAPSDDDAVPVAVPRAGAAALGASIGSTIPLELQGVTVRARVAALYDAVDRDGTTWSADLLSGAGEDPAHVDPRKPYGALIDVVGPLVAAPGALDRTGVRPSRVTSSFTPDFARTTVPGLESLAERMRSIDQIVAVDAGSAAESATAQTRVDDAVAGVLAQLRITRTVAAVAGLLLVVLAVAVLAQAALLLDAARTDERALLAARGATRAQLVGLAAWEAVAGAVVALVLGVPLGALLACAVRGAPALPVAGSWTAGAAIALVAVTVRLLPRLRPAERAPGRRPRASGLLRTGADLVLVVLAAVLGWQLVVRRVDPTAGVDPVVVAAPAALVLAGALVALRLIPLAGRLGELLAARARGAATGLAGWEVSRRSARAAAAVLLVVLAVSSAAFGAISEATWVRSQTDQAALAVGAPVRVPADPAAAAAQGALLAADGSGPPQPSLRRPADVAAAGQTGADATEPLTDATVLGLTPAARAMLDRGRLREAGGAAIARLRDRGAATTGVALPARAGTLRAVVRAGDAASPIPGAVVEVRAVLDGPDDLLTTAPLGTVPVDGRDHALRGRTPAAGLRLVGLQLHLLVADPTRYRGNDPGLLRLRVLRVDAGGAVLRIPSGWTAITATGDADRGYDLPLDADLLQNPVTAAVVGWKPVQGVRSVWTRSLAAPTQATPGGRYALVLAGVLVPCEVVGVVPRAAGSGAAPASAPDASVAVVDQRTLTQFLVQSGDAEPLTDQWWVDVPPAQASAYLAAHRRSGGAGADGAVPLAERLTEGPLRVATTQALHLLLLGAAALGLVGLGVDVVASLAARRREMAQLRAIGLRRSALERLLALETTTRVAFGALLGTALGVLLGSLAAPALVVGPDGGRPVPSPVVVVPVLALAGSAAGAVVAAALIALAVVRTYRGLDPARILREGDG
ncbi:ABC transporter permease [Amnibacterium setariae]|uniref:ABC transporter permease n=1 Tax=Amnibacterium setariae TaxID=2306585 RepID=A0A3A1U2R3_9MICO|nr:ABC transporter permease [Amnibacterium setariae]RIX28147.1 ABC transporter permease [Amnibacterium setariae]